MKEEGKRIRKRPLNKMGHSDLLVKSHFPDAIRGQRSQRLRATQEGTHFNTPVPESELAASCRVVIDVFHSEGYLDTVLLTPRRSVPHQNLQRNDGILSQFTCISIQPLGHLDCPSH